MPKPQKIKRKKGQYYYREEKQKNKTKQKKYNKATLLPKGEEKK